ncbi:hypothetical protein FHS18_000621 [Paenibacillus phyllosphaerae]|uniref:Uncharacterized protein n=1 Tax=Paenibacillus phyllosphaerae TaxID=274593 RepID=A0A7W5ATX4_9BACL|nr:hypothetical protein [Paenibacillus phyllosphaerae]MBB3108593.1 hypothetical protein [Paenibacillus phyllosphaerae]
MMTKPISPVVLTWQILARSTWLTFTLFWGVSGILTVLLLAVDSPGIRSSYWEQVFEALNIYAFVVGVRVTYGHLTILMNHGVTRKQMALATLLFALVFTLANGIMMGIGFALEHAAYSSNAWQEAFAQPHLFKTAVDFPAIVAEGLILSASTFLGGHFIATTFYRFGKIIGMFSIGLYLLISFSLEVRSYSNAIVTFTSDLTRKSDFTAAEFFLWNGGGIALLALLIQYMLQTTEIKAKTR